MSQVFAGSVLLPGEQGPGLSASLEVDNATVSLMTGDDALGRWSESQFDVQPSGKGSFRLDLGGEELFFTPTSPAKFAEAMHVPLQPEAPKKADEPKYDFDAAIDEMIAQVRPLTSLEDEDEILSKPIMTGILLASGTLVAALVGMTVIF